MEYIREWISNIFRTLLIAVAVIIGMLIFAAIFYPETIDFFILIFQTNIQLASALKLWPILVLAFFVSAMPRRRRKHYSNSSKKQNNKNKSG